MKTTELFKEKNHTMFSFEIFPPKKTSPIESISKTLDEICALNPDYISVTYGAGGNLADNSTLEIAKMIKHKYSIEPMVHLTCVNNSKSDIDILLERFKENSIQNILALRGDINPEISPKDDFKYASELVSYIKEHGDFCVSSACYPEGHVESPTFIDDIRNLKIKVDCGAEHLISQLFFDNSVFYNFYEKAQIAGINVPIEAGIMPVLNKGQVERMISMCGSSLPSKFTKMMQRYENHPEALRDAGIAYAIDQIVDLVSQGVDGIHLYVMNNPYVAKKIKDSISSIIGVK